MTRTDSEPGAERPYMPGYLAPGAGGTLPWSWAEERLRTSRYYWVATVWPSGKPHVSPVWGVWLEQRLWFSCDLSSRKAKNLAHNPACSITTQDPLEPVVVDGVVAAVLERGEVERYVDAERVKYATEWQVDTFTVDFFDGNLGGGCTFQLTPSSVFGLIEKEFGTSPTRWRL